MITPQNAIVLVPARMASTRLPGKPLADIAGLPMIVHVWRRAMEADVGPVVVACAEQEIIDAVTAAGGRAVATAPDHPSGSDRIFEALQRVDEAGRYDIVVNLQGDLPTLDPGSGAGGAATARRAGRRHRHASLRRSIDAEERADPNVVKAAVAFADGNDIGRALYFSRNPVPWGDGPTLASHRALCLSPRRPCPLRRLCRAASLERRERLEQLRALENGMRIDVARVDDGAARGRHRSRSGPGARPSCRALGGAGAPALARPSCLGRSSSPEPWSWPPSGRPPTPVSCFAYAPEPVELIGTLGRQSFWPEPIEDLFVDPDDVEVEGVPPPGAAGAVAAATPPAGAGAPAKGDAAATGPPAAAPSSPASPAPPPPSPRR